jgi:hypothetical protein
VGAGGDERIDDVISQDSQDSRLRANPSLVSSQTSTSRRGKQITSDSSESLPDVRFFAELVKPMQYRLRNQQKEREKVITPSKHGYHPRSKSPTFKRLIAVMEKLQIVASCEDNRIIRRFEEDLNLRPCPSIEKLFEDENNNKIPKLSSYSEPSFSRPISETLTPNQEVELEKPETKFEFKPEIIPEVEADIHQSTPIATPRKPRLEAYANLKKEPLHTELHLFLPQIHESGIHRELTGDSIHPEAARKGECVVLPTIDSTSHGKAATTKKSKKSKQKEDVSEVRKKVKKREKLAMARCGSASDQDNVSDMLNDVPTLISIENEKSHKHSSVCPFNGCPYHSKIAPRV